MAERRGVRVWQAFSGSCRVGRVGWASVPGLRAPRFFLCAYLLRAGVFLWCAVGLLFLWVRGRLAWVFSPVFVRASA